MKQHQESLRIDTGTKGLHDVTSQVAGVVRRAAIETGLAVVFVRHTSASLIINENADPDVQRDLSAFLDRLVPEGDPLYRHVDEGPDDMPAHVKAALTASSLSIPIANGALALGTWQGLYLWEHRRRPSPRTIVVHINGV